MNFAADVGGGGGGGCRLVVASDKAQNSIHFRQALHNDVVMVQYRHDNSTLNGIVGLIDQAIAPLAPSKLSCLAIVFAGVGGHPSICAQGGQVS